MYLSNDDIKGRLQEINFETYNSSHPFKDDIQIQPCSVDVRLSDVFWQPLKGKTVDLRKSRLLEISPRMLWKKRIIKDGEYISLKPGEMLLGRIYEKFTVPKDCACKIEGRSSFARLGLGIHCTGDFINPGYRGHMPMQLVNSSPHTIKIFPFIPICQLIFVKLSNTPSKLYGEEELQHKYEDDDGGPSYWWRDKRIKSLQKRFQEVDISLEIQERILEKIGVQDPEIIERMEKFVSKTQSANLQNADFILEEFIKKEQKNRIIWKAVDIVCYTIFGALFSASVGIIFSKPITKWHWIIWAITLISFAPFLWAILRHKTNYLTDINKVRTADNDE